MTKLDGVNKVDGPKLFRRGHGTLEPIFHHSYGFRRPQTTHTAVAFLTLCKIAKSDREMLALVLNSMDPAKLQELGDTLYLQCKHLLSFVFAVTQAGPCA